MALRGVPEKGRVAAVLRVLVLLVLGVAVVLPPVVGVLLVVRGVAAGPRFGDLAAGLVLCGVIGSVVMRRRRPS
jgi:hypothetical protein